MELFFNELSVLPAVNSGDLARQKIITLLETMKTLKDLGFNVLRTHDNFYGESLGGDYTFSTFISDPEVSNVQKILLRTIIKNPFIEEDESIEAEMFITNNYETINHLNQFVNPEGIAIAHLNISPTVSLCGFPLWENDTLNLKITNTSNNTSSNENVINLFSPISLTNKNFKDWLESTKINIELNSYENIIKVFPTDKFEFDPRAINEIISWYFDDNRYIIRIKKLIDNIRNAPFVGGIGLTENLGGGRGSKRIVKKDRVVYTVFDDRIIIHSCKKHYNDQ